MVSHRTCTSLHISQWWRHHCRKTALLRCSGSNDDRRCYCEYLFHVSAHEQRRVYLVTWHVQHVIQMICRSLSVSNRSIFCNHTFQSVSVCYHILSCWMIFMRRTWTRFLLKYATVCCDIKHSTCNSVCRTGAKVTCNSCNNQLNYFINTTSKDRCYNVMLCDVWQLPV